MHKWGSGISGLPFLCDFVIKCFRFVLHNVLVLSFYTAAFIPGAPFCRAGFRGHILPPI